MLNDRLLNFDLERPKQPFSRDMALMMVENMIPDIGAEAAQKLWDTLLAPLYDSREAAEQWPRGKCRRCGVPHPATALGARYKKQDPVTGVAHRMYCPKYVGPLTHSIVDISMTWTGDKILCSCGQNYPRWGDEDATVENLCPDVLVDWRGPKDL